MAQHRRQADVSASARRRLPPRGCPQAGVDETVGGAVAAGPQRHGRHQGSPVLRSKCSPVANTRPRHGGRNKDCPKPPRRGRPRCARHPEPETGPSARGAGSGVAAAGRRSRSHPRAGRFGQQLLRPNLIYTLRVPTPRRPTQPWASPTHPISWVMSLVTLLVEREHVR